MLTKCVYRELVGISADDPVITLSVESLLDHRRLAVAQTMKNLDKFIAWDFFKVCQVPKNVLIRF